MADVTIIRPGPIEQIARALRGRLELVFPPNKPFSHQWMPARVDRDAWRRLTERMPMVAIGFNEFQRVQTQSSLAVISYWTIFAATKNERGQEGLMFGDKLAPGLLSLMQVAAAAVHGFTMPGLGTIQVTKAANAMIEEETDPSLGIAAIDLEVKADLALAGLLSGPDVAGADLAMQQIVWNFDGASLTDIINTGTS